MTAGFPLFPKVCFFSGVSKQCLFLAYLLHPSNKNFPSPFSKKVPLEVGGGFHSVPNSPVSLTVEYLRITLQQAPRCCTLMVLILTGHCPTLAHAG